MSYTTTNVRHLTINDIYRGKVLVVSPDGNNVDPVRGFSNMSMFITIKAAVDAATSGDLIYVLPGTYNENGLIKDNINYYFCQGAKLWFTGTGNSVNDNRSIIRGSNITVDGFGDFRFDYPVADASVVNTILDSFIFNIVGGTTNFIRGYKAYTRNFLLLVNNTTMSLFEFEEVGFIPNTINYTVKDSKWCFILLSGNVHKINISIVNYNVFGNTLKYARLFQPFTTISSYLNINTLNINNVITGTDALCLIFAKNFKISIINMTNCSPNCVLAYSGSCDIIEIDIINSTVVHKIEMVGKLGILKINTTTPLTNISYNTSGTSLITDNAIIEVKTCRNLTICGNYSSQNLNRVLTLNLKIDKCEEIIIFSEITKTIFWNNLECTKMSINRHTNFDLTINPELHFYGNVKINLINPTQPAFTNLCTNLASEYMLRFYNYGNIITNSTHLFPFGGTLDGNILYNDEMHKTLGQHTFGDEPNGLKSRGLYHEQPM